MMIWEKNPDKDASTVNPKPAISPTELAQDVAQTKGRAPSKAHLFPGSTSPKPEMTAQDYFERAKARGYDDLVGKIADYTDAIRLKPDYGEAYFLRGFTRRRLEDINGAIADYTEAIRLKPSDAESFFWRGKELATQRSFDQAINDYSEAIRLDPEYIEAYYNRAYLYAIKKDFRKALADGQMFLKLAPNDSFSATLSKSMLAWQNGRAG